MRERLSHGSCRRLPRRPADLIEGAVAWLLVLVGVLVTVAAVVTGSRLYSDGMDRVRVESTDRTRVVAVLLEPAKRPTAGRITRATSRVHILVPAGYTDPGGVEHVAEVRVVGPKPVGSPVPIWVDGAGAAVGAPARGVDAVEGAITGAFGIAVPGAAALAAGWSLVRLGARRVNLARWEREWAQVEPRWSGRTRA